MDLANFVVTVFVVENMVSSSTINLFGFQENGKKERGEEQKNCVTSNGFQELKYLSRAILFP